MDGTIERFRRMAECVRDQAPGSRFFRTLLERMWGIRHVVVHRAGVADADFVKWHPGVVKAVGDRVGVSNPDIVLFLRAVSDFVNPTDLYFLKRCPALLATRPPASPSKP